uniref:E2 ubiquitin-conjugating enzyme n=1 Tax=Grammatophora oceanica TaxID=210454 RepID=A0A7S1V7Z1_9STRA|mmetsp:Transcript_37667/g.56052  ORF Transcript_37667/g.56052 Transcript_37667/m.56052 type:complete len:214 (+) Transcript_37667:330-971(+)|eukprot:CAMPEP_0194034360 /NCGR_PEP_ID=MMETSP0009_2-20130614/6766_1 /TAXON_ID=210454 /ORGANISM="Grammatophora oceanica, Strain CCMP 410" /LENGTH=213 /DNA_ID=CAMNT_0038675241 /DNA_START=323 /DNA_END=964 /DNA_ORIENTATION=+
MATATCAKRLAKELRSLQKDPIKEPVIKAVPNEANILEWHYVVEGSKGTPYEGGFYHGKLLFPKEYPFKAPGIMMCTPSGRFHTNRRLCLSMSDYHPESWNPLWSVGTILQGLVSFMLDSQPTLGSIVTSKSEKRRLARQSLRHNVKDPMFRKLFPEYVELHQQRLRDSGLEEEPTIQNDSVTNSDTMELQGLTTFAAAVIAILSIFFAFKLI